MYLSPGYKLIGRWDEFWNRCPYMKVMEKDQGYQRCNSSGQNLYCGRNGRQMLCICIYLQKWQTNALHLYFFAEEIWEVLAPQYPSYTCVYAIWLIKKHQRFFPQNIACTLLQALHKKLFCVTLLNDVFNFDKLHSAELFFLYFFYVRNARNFPGSI